MTDLSRSNYKRCAPARWIDDLAKALQNRGFFVPAIRYPTVATGSVRLLITVTAAHTKDQIRALCEAIARLSAEML